jgi:hypothetical protein
MFSVFPVALTISPPVCIVFSESLEKISREGREAVLGMDKSEKTQGIFKT